MLNLYILSVSFVSNFFFEFIFKYITSREHRLMINIIIFVHKKNSTLKNYQWDFTIRLEKNRVSQELKWSMHLKTWAHRRNWRFKTSEVNIILIIKSFCVTLYIEKYVHRSFVISQMTLLCLSLCILCFCVLWSFYSFFIDHWRRFVTRHLK